jgi:hypothetical protein
MRSLGPTVAVAEAAKLAHPAEEEELIDLFERPVQPLVGRPHMKAVKADASSGLRPFTSRSR